MNAAGRVDLPVLFPVVDSDSDSPFLSVFVSVPRPGREDEEEGEDPPPTKRYARKGIMCPSLAGTKKSLLATRESSPVSTIMERTEATFAAFAASRKAAGSVDGDGPQVSMPLMFSSGWAASKASHSGLGLARWVLSILEADGTSQRV